MGVREIIRMDITPNYILHDTTGQEDPVQNLRAVASAADQLIQCTDTDALFKLSVELGRSLLGCERTAIIVASGDEIHGIYGTDRENRTVDEHARRIPLSEEWAELFRPRTPAEPKWSILYGDLFEWRDGQQESIGSGWTVYTPVQTGQRVHAVYVNDTAMTGRACNSYHQELLAVFCALLAQFVENKGIQSALRRERNVFIGGPVIVFEVYCRESWPVEYVSRNINQLGYAPDQFTGNVKNYSDIVYPDDYPLLKAWTEQLIQGDADTSEISYRVVRSDGVLRWVNDYTVVIRNNRGIPVRLLRYLADITERKRLEKELVQSKNEAEAGMQARSQFLANMSHEVRTPLNAIIGFSKLALEHEADSEKKQYLEIIQNAGEDLLVIINDILDFSKIEAGKLQLSYEPFSLREVTRETIASMKLHADVKQLSLDLHYAEDVPETVIADSVRYRQIMTNLISNAIKFTEAGTIAIRITRAEKQSDEQKKLCVHCAVSDTGIGIPRDVQTYIFDHFTQADNSTSRDYGGTGLGLSICKRLVELMEGSIWVESTPGKGSTFHFEMCVDIPIEIDASPAEPYTPLTDHVRAGTSQRRVLLAEDKPTNQMIAQKLLERLGHMVVIAENGADVLTALRADFYDIILMDIFMPVMDGFETTMQIREHEKNGHWHVPIIAMTAHAMHGDRQKCIDAGMDDYISKPIDENKLKNLINKWCE